MLIVRCSGNRPVWNQEVMKQVEELPAVAPGNASWLLNIGGLDWNGSNRSATGIGFKHQRATRAGGIKRQLLGKGLAHCLKSSTRIPDIDAQSRQR